MDLKIMAVKDVRLITYKLVDRLKCLDYNVFKVAIWHFLDE